MVVISLVSLVVAIKHIALQDISYQYITNYNVILGCKLVDLPHRSALTKVNQPPTPLPQAEPEAAPAEAEAEEGAEGGNVAMETCWTVQV